MLAHPCYHASLPLHPQIAGVNCLRLINETTATALAYGIYKTDLPETDPVHVAFVDVGHCHTQVGTLIFNRMQIQVGCRLQMEPGR